MTSENGCQLPTRGLTYPTLGKGKSSSNMPFWGDMLVSWRVPTPGLSFRLGLKLNLRFDLLQCAFGKIGCLPKCGYNFSGRTTLNSPAWVKFIQPYLKKISAVCISFVEPCLWQLKRPAFQDLRALPPAFSPTMGRPSQSSTRPTPRHPWKLGG